MPERCWPPGRYQYDQDQQDGPTRREYLAHEATGDEKAAWWARALEIWPDYAGYQERTERQIPVFVLEPMDDGR